MCGDWGEHGDHNTWEQKPFSLTSSIFLKKFLKQKEWEEKHNYEKSVNAGKEATKCPAWERRTNDVGKRQRQEKRFQGQHNKPVKPTNTHTCVHTPWHCAVKTVWQKTKNCVAKTTKSDRPDFNSLLWPCSGCRKRWWCLTSVCIARNLDVYCCPHPRNYWLAYKHLLHSFPQGTCYVWGSMTVSDHSR